GSFSFPFAGWLENDLFARESPGRMFAGILKNVMRQNVEVTGRQTMADGRGQMPLFSNGPGGDWVFGPRVAWIAPRHLLTHAGIGCFPEACQIFGDLLRLSVRRQQMQQQWYSSSGNAGSLSHAENLL